MAKSDDLIKLGEKKMNIAEIEFLNAVKRSEGAIFGAVQKLFETVGISGGKLQSNKKTTEFLMGLELRIYDALQKSGYNEAVVGYLKNFDAIRDNNILLQDEMNGFIISKESLSDVTRLETQNAINRLTRSGISKDFIQPIQQSLYRNIFLGADINEAQKTIQDYVLTNEGQDSKLLRYTKQVARDTINQYDGAIQKSISNVLDLPDFIYAGSLIQDSRGQCRHWVEKTELSGEELRSEIQVAINGGTLSGMRCSGMIPETSVDTFSIYRGGYNCRHRAIATKL